MIFYELLFLTTTENSVYTVYINETQCLLDDNSCGYYQ